MGEREVPMIHLKYCCVSFDKQQSVMSSRRPASLTCSPLKTVGCLDRIFLHG